MPLAKYFLSRYVENMPAQITHNFNGDNAYSHVYNRGVDGRLIFKDSSDYSVFLGYLQEYLTPINHNGLKKEFIVNGKGFRGIPHQPKNYFGKIELIAYSLNADHFHIVIKQNEIGSLESFMRSLSTRYSIYFNKKYQRKGSLFEGPYKSVAIADLNQLILLTTYLHQEKGATSLSDFIGNSSTVWVKHNVITSSFNTSYEDYLKNHCFSQDDNQQLNKIIIENITNNNKPLNIDKEQIQYQQLSQPKKVTKPRTLEYFSLSAIFVILTGLGLLNISKVSAQDLNKQVAHSSIPQVLSDSDSFNTPNSTVAPSPKINQNSIQKTMIMVSDGPKNISIFKQPLVDSEIASYAIFGETFELIETIDDWCKIKLTDNTIGYIQKEYIEVIDNNI